MSHLPYYTIPIHPLATTNIPIPTPYTPYPDVVAGCQTYSAIKEIEALKERIAHLEYWIERLVPDSK